MDEVEELAIWLSADVSMSVGVAWTGEERSSMDEEVMGDSEGQQREADNQKDGNVQAAIEFWLHTKESQDLWEIANREIRGTTQQLNMYRSILIV